MTTLVKLETEWKVRPPATSCAACGRSFNDGETILSRLQLHPEAGHCRVDVCLNCAGGVAAPHISAWRTTWRCPPPVAEPIQKETAESLLRRLVEARDERHLASIFVLAVMLERKRILVERDVELLPNGRRRRIYEHRPTGDVFIILDPRLHLDDLERVQGEVARLLDGTSPASITPPDCLPDDI